MKLGSIEINSFTLYALFFILAIIFKDYFGKYEIYLTVLWFLIIGFFLMAFSGYEDKAKLEERKLIGRGVRTSFLLSERLSLGNGFYAIAKGGYFSELLGKVKGSEGIIIYHHTQLDVVDQNGRLIGDKVIFSQFNIRNSWQIKIKNHFGYLPVTFEVFRPLQEKFILNSNVEVFISDLQNENGSLSQENNYLKNTLSNIGMSATQYVDKSGALIETANKSVKKSIKLVNPKE